MALGPFNEPWDQSWELRGRGRERNAWENSQWENSRKLRRPNLTKCLRKLAMENSQKLRRPNPAKYLHILANTR
eukprot:5790454-Karenia_brevis.AAC.2